MTKWLGVVVVVLIGLPLAFLALLSGPNVSQQAAAANDCGAPETAVLGTFTPGSIDEAPFVGTASKTKAEARSVASTIIAVGQQRRIPPRGLVIAIATAMQESQLRNLDHGDRDSLGAFQQRPSQGWGSPAQLQNPTWAAGQFYDALLQVPDWQQMPLTQAAQAVQRSGFPDAYAQWEASARVIVQAYSASTSTAGSASTAPVAPLDPSALNAAAEQCPNGGAPNSFVGPLVGADVGSKTVNAGLAEVAKGIPYSWGGGGPSGPSRGFDAGASTVGYDCSSFAQMAWYRGSGGTITLPRTAKQQHDALPAVSLSQLQPGDLLFFGPGGGRVTHVMVFVGNGAIAEAPRTGLSLRTQTGFISGGAW
ncbi:C40 family peptidase [Mobilicoccus caccae]|uniref:NlpC/P60 domain-containing protein n=1 Tax=Mobilicoccus caccae TaxID=1859295 RepID=A0ABQ6J0B2_9MICO|nr:NlpC/P60 family protein [Mobilicoccus caccae]GMA42408.1 hypothetical protein GCM10025883_44530 [Mobilicoccus caccae]GMA42483.1 hypothetical protein GCM10025883_45280 [Mobilicoccus caccae]